MFYGKGNKREKNWGVLLGINSVINSQKSWVFIIKEKDYVVFLGNRLCLYKELHDGLN